LSRIYFTDRDLGKLFPETLAAAGLAVERHHDLFPPDGPDEQWLEHCGRNARIAITHNERSDIRRTSSLPWFSTASHCWSWSAKLHSPT
jgi:hypothetical protein